MVLAVAAPSLLYYNGDLDGNPDLFHEGDRLGHYETLQRGGLPFRDVFVQQGLGENIVKPWLACRLFGPSLASLRRLGTSYYIIRGYLPALGMAALLLAVASLVRSRKVLIAAAAASLLVWCDVSDRHLFGFLALACMGRYFTSRRSGWLALAGACTGLAVLYSIDVGVFAAIATTLTLIGQRLGEARRRTGRRVSIVAPMAAFLAGLACVLAPFVCWCALRGIVGDMLHNLRVQLFLRGETMPAGYQTLVWHGDGPLWPNLLNNAQIVLFFYALPGLALLGCTLCFWRQRASSPRAASSVLLTASFAAASWSTVWSRCDHYHMAYVVPMFVLLGAVAADRASSLASAAWFRRMIAALAVTIAVGLVVAARGGPVVRRLWGVDALLTPENGKTAGKHLVDSAVARLGGVRVEPEMADFLRRAVAEIQRLTGPDDTYLDLSDCALLFFLSGRRSATRYILVSQIGPSRRLQQQVVAELLAQPSLPRAVIRFRGDAADDVLNRFVNVHYVVDAVVGPMECLRRADAPN